MDWLEEVIWSKLETFGDKPRLISSAIREEIRRRKPDELHLAEPFQQSEADKFYNRAIADYDEVLGIDFNQKGGR